MFKRISAFLFDLILLCIVAVGCAYLLSACLGYDAPLAELDSIKVTYEQEYTTTEYEVKFEISSADYEALTEENIPAALAENGKSCYNGPALKIF